MAQKREDKYRHQIEGGLIQAPPERSEIALQIESLRAMLDAPEAVYGGLAGKLRALRAAVDAVLVSASRSEGVIHE